MKRKILLFMTAAVIMTMTVFVFAGCSMTGIYPNAEKYTAGDGEISGTVEKIDVDWTSGNIILKTDGESTVRISEEMTGSDSDEAKVHWWLDGTTLRIKFMGSGAVVSNINKKELTVILPESLILNEADISSASADVKGMLNAKKIKIDTASGNVDLNPACETDSIKVDTASGDVKLNVPEKADVIEVDTSSGKISLELAKADKIEAETASGDITADFAEIPSSCKVDTASGSVTLKVPEDGDFTLEFDTASGDFESDVNMKTKKGKYVCGDGTSKISVDTASGDVRVIKR